jgi:hypothetical protein
MLPLGEAVERDEAAARGGVMGGAEGNASVDLKGESPGRHLAAVMAPMHQEAAGAYRPTQALGFRYPILRRKRLDPEGAKPRVACSGLDQLRQQMARGLASVVRRHLNPIVAALEQGHRQGGRTLGGFKLRSDRFRAYGGCLDGRDKGDWLGLVRCPH